MLTHLATRSLTGAAEDEGTFQLEARSLPDLKKWISKLTQTHRDTCINELETKSKHLIVYVISQINN